MARRSHGYSGVQGALQARIDAYEVAGRIKEGRRKRLARAGATPIGSQQVDWRWTRVEVLTGHVSNRGMEADRILPTNPAIPEDAPEVKRAIPDAESERPGGTSCAEVALREKEAFNFALFQYHPSPMTLVDREGRVVKSNLARRHSGVPLPPLGEPLFCGPEDGYELDMVAALRRVLDRGEVVRLPEQRHGERYEQITIAPVPGGAIVITQDVTARRQAEEVAAARHQELIQAQKLATIGTLITGVAHEISNPNHIMVLSAAALRKIIDQLLPVLDRYHAEKGDLQIGRRPYPEVRNEIPELVNTIRRAAERVQTFLQDLKSFARQETTDLTDTVRIAEVIRGAVSLLGPMIRKATRRFEVIHGDDMLSVRGSAQRLEQVLVNLLTNACQALESPEKGLTVRSRRSADGEKVEIEVCDEGRGILPEHLARLTDPFFTTRQDEGGTGLGLSIARAIVEAHGGTLSFTSAPGRGTTALVTLPAYRELAGG